MAANGFAQNGFSAYSMVSAFLFEMAATFIFVMVILRATTADGAGPMAGLAIGLTLVAIHLAGIAISGSAVATVALHRCPVHRCGCGGGLVLRMDTFKTGQSAVQPA